MILVPQLLQYLGYGPEGILTCTVLLDVCVGEGGFLPASISLPALPTIPTGRWVPAAFSRDARHW